jgi:hypothetical protein
MSPIVVAVLFLVVVLMGVGARRARRLPVRWQLLSAVVPLLLLVGGFFSLIVLSICGIADNPVPWCAATSALALPVVIGYLGVGGGSWLGSVIGSRAPALQRKLLGGAAVVAAAVPVVVFVAVMAAAHSSR